MNRVIAALDRGHVNGGGVGLSGGERGPVGLPPGIPSRREVEPAAAQAAPASGWSDCQEARPPDVR